MVIAIISVIISGLVAIAAIYRQVIHDWVFRPNLKVTFSLEEPVSRETTVKWPPEASEPSRWKAAFWATLKGQERG